MQVNYDEISIHNIAHKNFQTITIICKCRLFFVLIFSRYVFESKVRTQQTT